MTDWTQAFFSTAQDDSHGWGDYYGDPLEDVLAYRHLPGHDPLPYTMIVSKNMYRLLLIHVQLRQDRPRYYRKRFGRSRKAQLATARRTGSALARMARRRKKRES